MRDVPLRKPREERYCQLISKNVSPTEAYKQAGYAPRNTHAYRLNGRPHIKDRIAELRGHTAAVTNTSRESLMLDTIKAQAKAENEGHLVAWIRAIELRAKLAGLLVDRVAIDSRVHYAISDQPMSDDEWRAKYVDSARDKWRQNTSHRSARSSMVRPDAVAGMEAAVHARIQN